MPARIPFCDSFFYYIAGATVSTAIVSTTATVSTATTVESTAGVSSAALGAQDAKAKATTKNKITFFISLNLLKLNMFVLQFKIDAKVHHFLS